MSLNKVSLIGNVGKDPEIRFNQYGGKFAALSLATTEKWKDKDGNKQERTEWHNIMVSGDGLAGVVERYVQKGSKLYLEGKLQTRKYEKDGIERYTTSIIVDSFTGKLLMLGGNESGDKATYQPSPVNSATASNIAEPMINDEIPF